MSDPKKLLQGIAEFLFVVAWLVYHNHYARHIAAEAVVELVMPDPAVKLNEEGFRAANVSLQISLDEARMKCSSEDLKPFYARIQRNRESGKSLRDQTREIRRICFDLRKFTQNAPTPTNGFVTAMQEKREKQRRLSERYRRFAGIDTNPALPPGTK